LKKERGRKKTRDLEEGNGKKNQREKKMSAATGGSASLRRTDVLAFVCVFLFVCAHTHTHTHARRCGCLIFILGRQSSGHIAKARVFSGVLLRSTLCWSPPPITHFWLTRPKAGGECLAMPITPHDKIEY